MAPSRDPRKLRAIKERDRALAHERVHGKPRPIVVSAAGRSLRLRFPDGAVVLMSWEELLDLCERGAPLVTPDGQAVTGLHAVARRLPG